MAGSDTVISYATLGLTKRHYGRVCAVSALFVSITGNALITLFDFRCLSPIPVGSSIRPMGQALIDLLIGAGTFFVVITLVIFGLTDARRLFWFWAMILVATALAFAPLPLSRQIWDFIAAKHGLVFES